MYVHYTVYFMQGVIPERRTVKIISFITCLDYEGYILSDKDYRGLHK